MVDLEDLPAPTEAPQSDRSLLLQRQQAFNYTFEDLNMILAPMGRDGVEPIGLMGNDTPLAVLSQNPQPLYNYFQQLFAHSRRIAGGSISRDHDVVRVRCEGMRKPVVKVDSNREHDGQTERAIHQQAQQDACEYK